MASLRRIPNAKGNPWEVRWRDQRTGKQPRRRYTTRELADRAFREALRIEGLDPMTPVERTATVGELVKMEEKTSSRGDKKTNRSYIKNHVPQAFLRREARTVAIEDIEDILNTAAGRLSEESVKKLRRTLNVVFKFAVQRRYLATNPVTGARIAAKCQTSRRARKMVDDEIDPDEIPSPGEITAIARAIESRFYALVLTLGFLGLRLGEAAGLDVAHWSPDRRVLRVWRSQPTTERTKGHRSFRDVDVPESLAAVINQHVAEFCVEDGPLFPAPQGGRLNPHNFRSRKFYKAVDAALGQEALDKEMRRRIRPHDCRHTAASLMIERGVSDREIANQLGHANAAFTRRVYAGVWRRLERQVSSKMDNAIADQLAS